MTHHHLRLSRDEPVTDRHRRSPIVHKFSPGNPREFGGRLLTKFVAVRERIEADMGGFDNRHLLKIMLREGEIAPQIEAIPGIEIISQEEKTVVLAFASEAGLQGFEARLTTLAQSGAVTRKEIFYAIEDFDRWTSEDRKGNALSSQGFPERETFTLDIELWPLEATGLRVQMLEAFVQWSQLQGIEIFDRLIQPSLVMLRIQASCQQAEAILEHRDVRTVDLPPRLGVSIEMLFTDINQFPQVSAPEADAPSVVILDSGLTSNHPLIAAAVGEAQGFVEPERNASDSVPNGHGTFIAGLALYGDIEAGIRSGVFIPGLRLFSGKVFNDDGSDQHEFVERAVEEAVRYFFESYQCRVFNFSYGDLNKTYDGRHVRGLAYTLDRLTRELGVLFVVPTGNLEIPDDPRATYPDYLFRDEARLLDPATALNAITVGGVTRHMASRDAQRYPNRIEDLPIATEWQPAPFTRSGLSVGGAIKPDFVDEAGNAAVMRTGGRIRYQGLGLASLNSGFAGGGVFREDFGTSFAAPIVAHKAAKLVGKFPDGSVNLARAMLAVHAKLSFTLVSAASLEAATTAFTHGRDNGLRERSTNRTITGDDRKPGTLQMSRWKFKSSLANGDKLFVVITRQDTNWSTATDELESYALAIVLNDEENVAINLYERISLMLQARVQQRARARV